MRLFSMTTGDADLSIAKHSACGPCGAVGADEPRLILTGLSDAEIRADTSRDYRRRGLLPDRIARLTGVSVRQVYSDLIVAEAMHLVCPTTADILAN
jgi:hypothetical protein